MRGVRDKARKDGKMAEIKAGNVSGLRSTTAGPTASVNPKHDRKSIRRIQEGSGRGKDVEVETVLSLVWSF